MGVIEMSKASARKSLGEFKPVMVTDLGRGTTRTTVLGQRGRLERIQAQTKFYGGPSEVWHGERGVTFKTREEAVAYAQKHIDALEARRAKAQEEYNARHKKS